jgi:hypothetical protein
VTLIQNIFRTGEPPSAFQMGTLVLVPKGEPRKYCGIGLLKSLYKLTSCLVNKRVCDKVKFHDGVHGFRLKRSCSTAKLEVKLAMQLAKRTGRPYHQIFLDLLKAYDTLDQEHLYDIMFAYGLGPCMMKLLIASWMGWGVVPRKAGRYGNVIHRDRGVKQGDIPSPTFFNFVIDAILHAKEGIREASGETAELDMAFYADNGQIGGFLAPAVQRCLDVYTNLFARVGLKMNGTKTEAMTPSTSGKLTQIRRGAYQQKLAGTGAEYKTRSKEMGQCPVCQALMQKQCLARHVRDQHPETEMTRLDTEEEVSPVRPMRSRVYHLRMQGTDKTACPDGSCGHACAQANIMCRYFMYGHPQDTLFINGDTLYVKCTECGIMSRPSRIGQHRLLAQCQAGKRQQQGRAIASTAHSIKIRPVEFTVGPKKLAMVREFKYLGQVIACNDLDLPACIWNIARARIK